MRKLALSIVVILVLGSVALLGCGEATTPQSSGTTQASETSVVSNVGPTESTAASTETTTATSGQATVIKLKMASEKAPTHMDMTENFPGFFRMVEAATGGKYKIEVEYFPSNTILAQGDVYDGVVKGIVDVGQSSMSTTPKRFPVIMTLAQPGITNPQSTSAAVHAAMKLYAKYQPAELADTHLLFLYASGPGWLHTKSEITTIEQLKGKRIGCPPVAAPAVKAVGADAVGLPITDVYEAAQKGLIEGHITPAEGLEGWKFAEVFDYSVFSPYFYPSGFFFVTMNKGVWESLPDDLKVAFESVSAQAAARAGAIWDYINNHAIEFAAGIGHKCFEWPDADKAKLLEILKPVRAEYVKFLDEQGLPGEEIAATAAALVEEANKLQFETWAPAAK